MIKEKKPKSDFEIQVQGIFFLNKNRLFYNMSSPEKS